MIGRTLAHYQITELLGKGGMGEVYRGRDTKLDRDVAIKILPREMSGDPERVARFQREARTLASLQHQHIASIYGFEETPEARFLVMELAEGEDLSQRIARGALPVEEAVRIANQIATGLEVAHEQNIVHRDLKPANVKLGSDGQVKILDFGLARAYTGANDPQGDPSLSPTITAAMTQAGTILGTAAYMSPEQARGKAVDKRADIWAFGCVFYEMLTGRKPFGGDDITDVIASVVKSEPDWEALPSDTPPRLRILLWRCLQKDPRRRLRDIGEALFELGDSPKDPTGTFAALGSTREVARPRWPAFAGGVVVGAVLTAIALVALQEDVAVAPAPASPTAFQIVPPPDKPYVTSLWDDVAISPDGRTVIYSTTSSGNTRYSGPDMILARRDLDATTVQIVAAHQGGSNPMFSPDGGSVAFLRERRILRLALEGGPPSTICDSLLSLSGAGWADDGWIYLADGAGALLKVSEDGGDPVEIARVDREKGERRFTNPLVMPGGRQLIVGVLNAGMEAGGAIYVLSSDGGTRRFLTAGYLPIGFTPAGNLVFGSANTIHAQRFDAQQQSLLGESIALVPGAGEDADLSRNGTLVYGEGGAGDRREGRFIWVQRNGTVTPFSEASLVYPRYPRFSADGRRLVYTSGPAGNGQLWVLDLVHTGPPVNLTFEGHNTMAIFDPSGRWVAYDHAEELGLGKLSIIASDGSEMQARIISSVHPSSNPSAWTSDGRLILSVEPQDAPDAADIAVYSFADSTSHDLVATQFAEAYCALSPDERWLAYESNRSGTKEIWVQSIGDGAPRRVSPHGGADPVWARDGSELYYQQGSTMMAVPITQQDGNITLGSPVELFSDVFIPAEDFTPRSYDVHPDGRFLMVSDASERKDSPNIIVIENWGQDVDRRLAAGKDR